MDQSNQKSGTPISFGFIGGNTVRAESNSLTLISRKVSDHSFRPPPLPVTWSETKESRSVFGKILTGDYTAKPIDTLTTLGVEVRSSRDAKTQFIPQGHPVISRFVSGIDAYLGAVEKLHKARWTQGLIHSSSVLFLPVSGERTAVFPDLGFEWMGDIGEPHWLSNHPGAGYWNESADERQKAWIAGTKPENLAKDTGIAAKLIAECLLGRPISDTDERLNDPTPFWQAIRAAVAGEFANAGALKSALSGPVLIDALTASPNPVVALTPAKPGSKLPAVIIALLLLVIAAAVIFFVLKNSSTPSTTDSTPSTGTQPSKVTPPTTAAKPTTPTTVPSFVDLGEFLPVSPVIDAIIDALKKTANDKTRDETRLKLATELRKQVEATRDKLIKNDINKFEAAKQITPIIHNLKLLAKMPPYQDADLTAKEKSCLDYAEKFLQTWQR